MQELLLKELGGERVGVDPNAFTMTKAKDWSDHWEKKTKSTTASESSPTLVPVEENLVDLIWLDRPSVPQNSIYIHPLHLSGECIGSKLSRIKKQVSDGHFIVVSNLPPQISTR